MPTADQYTGPERRHFEQALNELEQSFASQNQIVTKLIVVSENTANSMQRMESWIVAHEQDYRAVRERLLSQELIGSNVSARLDKVTNAFEAVSTRYMNDRSRMLGAYAAAGSAGAFILGLLAVAKAFGFLN